MVNLTGSRASGRKMNRMWMSSQHRKYKVSVILWVGNWNRPSWSKKKKKGPLKVQGFQVCKMTIKMIDK